MEKEKIIGGIGSTERIVKTIKQEASDEASQIISEAKAYSKKRMEQAENEAKKLISEAEKSAGEEADRIIENAIIEAKIEVGRRLLDFKKRIFDSVIDKAKEILQNSVNSDEYREAMLHWILEGILVLNVGRVVISCSEVEKNIFDESFLKDLNVLLEKNLGKSIEVNFNKRVYLKKQGVIVETPDGRLSYNNTIDSRLNRLSEKIKNIIYETVWIDID